MLPDWVSNPGPLTYESGALLIRQGFPLQNNPKNLDMSYKKDLDFWDCFGPETLILQLN